MSTSLYKKYTNVILTCRNQIISNKYPKIIESAHCQCLHRCGRNNSCGRIVQIQSHDDSRQRIWIRAASRSWRVKVATINVAVRVRDDARSVGDVRRKDLHSQRPHDPDPPPRGDRGGGSPPIMPLPGATAAGDVANMGSMPWPGAPPPPLA